jgi:hypothetical protein
MPCAPLFSCGARALLTRTDSRLQFCWSKPMLTAEQNVIHNIALWFALALAQPALEQPAPTAAPKPSPAKPMPAKPAAKKPEPPKPDAAAQSGPCGIGVIPHIGETFLLQSFGITVFGNELKKVPIESWGLDDLLVARVRAAAGPHFAVRRMAYPANSFATFDDPPPFHNGENDLKEIAQTVSRAGGCERYIVAVRDAIRIGDSNIIVRGIGVYHRGGLIHRFNSDILVVLTALYVIDGRSFEILKRGYGGIADDDTLADRLRRSFSYETPIHGPSRELEDFAWPPPPDALTGLREPTRALLAASLDVALPRLLAP